jgi:hypothetical protein
MTNPIANGAGAEVPPPRYGQDEDPIGHGVTPPRSTPARLQYPPEPDHAGGPPSRAADPMIPAEMRGSDRRALREGDVR